MAERLTPAQRERQREIMRCLIEEPKAYHNNYVWWPTDELIARVQLVTGCSSQAASGALRSLVVCGLVHRFATLSRATNAAFRFAALAEQPEADRG